MAEKDGKRQMGEVNKTVDCLNEAFRRDPGAIHALISNRVPCNQDLAADPYVVVGSNLVIPGKQCLEVDVLGLLNGVLVANGLKEVTLKWSKPDLDSTCELLGFREYTQLPKDG